MAKQTNLYITATLKNPAASLANADGTSAKTLYTVGANDAVVKGITITSTDTAAQNIQLVLNDGVTDRVIGTVPVAIAAGTNGTTVGVDALSATWLPGLPLDQNGKRILPVAFGQVLKIKTPVAITAAKTVDVVCVVEEY